MKTPCLLSLRQSLLFLLLGMLIALLAGCGKNSAPKVCYTPNARGAAIAATAKSQLGTPYRYGGASPAQGFDCSGLVYWACARNGVAIPRKSSDQATAGHSVRRSDLCPGDIIVFKIPWSGYHTGIYLGQGKFIHSPKPRHNVRVESLSIDYWKKNYVTARRVARP